MILFCLSDYKLVDPHHVSEIIRTEPGNLLGTLFMEELRFLPRVNKDPVPTLPMVLHTIYKSITRDRLHGAGFKKFNEKDRKDDEHLQSIVPMLSIVSEHVATLGTS